MIAVPLTSWSKWRVRGRMRREVGYGSTLRVVREGGPVVRAAWAVGAPYSAVEQLARWTR